MKATANRAIETFLLITFPLALFAGCAGNGESKPTDHQALGQESVITAQTTDDSENTATSSAMKLLADTLSAVNMRSEDTSTLSQAQSQTQTQTQRQAQVETQEKSAADTQDDSSTGTVAELAVDDSTPATSMDMNEDNTENTAAVTKTALSQDDNNLPDDKVLDVKLQSGDNSNSLGANVSEPDLHIVNFASDTSDVDNTYLAELEQHALFLKANPNLALNISGHADSRGSHSYNEKLSLKRAQEIYKILISDGAPESQLIVDSFGDTSPLNNKDNYSENRRVELEYMDSVKMHLSVR